MKLIVGLGNPGKAYTDSRHNIGFSAVKALARSYKILLKKERGVFSRCAKAKIENQSVILALPLTFMNLSGPAIGALLKKYRVDLDNLLVVCDDLDLGFGRLKMKHCGSSGGHRGLQSIIDFLNCSKFSRLRIGIGRPYPNNIEASRYVLSPFTKKEKEQIRTIIKEATNCCRTWILEGTTKTMNIFNQPRK